uniref:Putative ixodes 8-cys protein n=1 Tax=Ixodes ricinus TaxID=34613 RepID=A0A0K8RIX6_IXORI
MFKLKFFTLFVLAGLCFGSGNGEGEGHSPGEAETAEGGDTSADQGNNEKKPEESADDGKSKAGEEATAGKAGGNKAGHKLPNFIGTEEDKNDYVKRLLSTCSTKYNIPKINEYNISFPTCTFTCLSSTAFISSVNERIPKGMICNENNITCLDEGPCPSLPVPNC